MIFLMETQESKKILITAEFIKREAHVFVKPAISHFNVLLDEFHFQASGNNQSH